MKSVFIQLREYAVHASEVDRGIIRYILQYPEHVMEMSIQDLAKETFTSASSIVRLGQKVGFDGHKGLKKQLMRELAMQQQMTYSFEEEVALTDSVEVMADKVLYRHLFALQETKKLLDEAILDDCVSALIQAKTVYLFGIGASYLVAEDFHYKMMRVGKLCILCKDYDLQSLQADNMTDEDVAVVFSYSGQTKEMVRCCEKIHARGITIIAMTQVGTSPVADLSTYRLYVASKEVLIRSGAMSSRIAQLYMIDMFYSRYICRERDRAYKHIQQTQLYKEGVESL